ncbi:MAG TPA: PKD domain-containing protein [Candidatus Thermoplasmatota archaeon]|nr:PKD domain-containing protein [Candidatus Thermoplasmatota archaeon]
METVNRNLRAASKAPAAAIILMLAVAPLAQASHLLATIDEPAPGTVVNTGDDVQFSATTQSLRGACVAETYRWVFGDGAESTDEAPTHAYGAAGVYVVQFWADGQKCPNAAGHSALASAEVTVADPIIEPPPVEEPPVEEPPVEEPPIEEPPVEEPPIEEPPVEEPPIEEPPVEEPPVEEPPVEEPPVEEPPIEEPPVEEPPIEEPPIEEPPIEEPPLEEPPAEGGEESGPGPLAAIIVTGPDHIRVGRSATFDLAGEDAEGNPVPLAETTFVFTAPGEPGTVEVSYSEGDVTGSATVEVVRGGGGNSPPEYVAMLAALQGGGDSPDEGDAPAPPEGLGVAEEQGSLVAAWDPVPDASGYELSLDGVSGPGADDEEQPLPFLADGFHVLSVRAHGDAGDSGMSMLVFHVDTMGPPAPMMLGPLWGADGAHALWLMPNDDSGIAGYSLAFDVEPDDTVDTTDSEVVVPPGGHVVFVRAMDTAGNWGPAAALVVAPAPSHAEPLAPASCGPACSATVPATAGPGLIGMALVLIALAGLTGTGLYIRARRR